MAAATAAAEPRRNRVVQARRGVELGMLLFAMIVAVGAFVAIGLAHDRKVPTSLLPYAGGLAALVALAHIVVRRTAPYADPLMLPCAALLNGIGLALIYRLDLAAAARAAAAHKTAHSMATLQLAWTAIAIGLFIAVLLLARDHRRLQRYTYTSMVAGLALLALPLVLPARFSMINGVRRWIKVAGFSIQPGEFSKILLVIFFAGFLVTKRDALALASRRFVGIDLPRGRDLGPVIVAWLASIAILVLGRDLGSSLLFFGIFIVMLYVATERRSWLFIGLVMFSGGAYIAYQLFAHVRLRFDIWLHPFTYAADQSFQLVQAMYGFASGGILGTGLDQGRPDLVPFASSDFIISTVGEELGLTGLMAILLVYVVIVSRGLRAALTVRDSFGKLLACGLAFGMAFQVFVVVGGVMRLIPLTGITTPFLSYGGSSLLANWMIIALLLRISDASRRPAPPPGPAVEEAVTQVVQPIERRS
jgi:cell division protein FtsW (lipid II flippase)